MDIQTDLDWFGFDEFEDIKSEVYLKYDEAFIMSNLIEKDIYETGEKFCDVTFKLSEDVRTQRRVYTKFITILGDVGGLMEVVFTLCRIISSFSVDILYEVSLVNRLFKFDLDKKNVSIKENEFEPIKPVINFKTIDKDIEKEKEKDKENPKENGDITVINLKRNSTRRKQKILSTVLKN